MHEVGLSQGILSVVLDIAGDRPVRRVGVRVGANHGVKPDTLELGFAITVVGGDEFLVDEVELDGDPPSVIRRPGPQASEPSRSHDSP